MRQLLLVAVLAALAASALTVVVCESLRPAPQPAPPGLTAAEMKAVLAEVLREAGRARREAAPPRAEAPAADEPPPAAAATRVKAAADTAGGEAPGAPVVRRGLPPGLSDSAPQLERFRQILPRQPDGSRNREAQAAELRRWMFRGEREVLDWFGQPDEVNPEGETEAWIYTVPTGGEPEHETFGIRLNKGRVVSFF